MVTLFCMIGVRLGSGSLQITNVLWIMLYFIITVLDEEHERDNVERRHQLD
jgi:hypothetical protein